jgi:hypothetical protein
VEVVLVCQVTQLSVRDQHLQARTVDQVYQVIHLSVNLKPTIKVLASQDIPLLEVTKAKVKARARD